MSASLPTRGGARPRTGPATTAAPRGFAGVLLSAPDRILALTPWWALTLMVLLLSNAFRPLLVIPGLLIATVAGFRLRPTPFVGGRSDVLASGAAFLGSGLCLLVGSVWVSQRFVITRDPDLYTLAAMWLTDHPGTDIKVAVPGVRPLGFSSGGEGWWMPQGNHLAPAFGALHGWLLGPYGVRFAAATGGALAVLAFFAVSRRLVGSVWALVVCAGLAVAAPMVLISRSFYSEPLAMVLTAAGTLFLISGVRGGVLRDIAVAGVAFGSVGMVRVDGVLPLLALPLGLALCAAFDLWPDGADPRRLRLAAPVLAVCAVPPAILGWADLRYHSTAYYQSTWPEMSKLYAGVVAAWVLAGAVVVLRRYLDPRRLRAVGVGGGGLLGLVFLVMLSRPFWYVARGDWDNSTLANLQQAQGLPVDGTRTYAESTLVWLSWYIGWPAVLLGLGALVWCVIAGTRRGGAVALLLAALVLPGTLLYLNLPNITPDQPWALRRFIVLIVPALLVGAALAMRRLWETASWGRVAAGAVALSLVGTGLYSVRNVILIAEHYGPRVPSFITLNHDYTGAMAGVRESCDVARGGPLVFAGVSTVPPTLRIACGTEIAFIRESSPTQVLDAARKLATATGRPLADVLLVTASPGQVTWTEAFGPATVPISWADWHTTLQRPPDGGQGGGTSLWFGTIDPGSGVATQLP